MGLEDELWRSYAIRDHKCATSARLIYWKCFDRHTFLDKTEMLPTRYFTWVHHTERFPLTPVPPLLPVHPPSTPTCKHIFHYTAHKSDMIPQQVRNSVRALAESQRNQFRTVQTCYHWQMMRISGRLERHECTGHRARELSISGQHTVTLGASVATFEARDDARINTTPTTPPSSPLTFKLTPNL